MAEREEYYNFMGVPNHSLEMANQELTTSLLFIQAKDLKFVVDESAIGKRKTRARFVYNKIIYNLVVTDPAVEKYFSKKDPGEHVLEDKEIFLCISLGEPFDGYCYKLVASVITR